MQLITTVTQKGQITIPKSLRQKFGIESFSKVYLEADRGGIKITSSYDILDLAGKFKPQGQKKSVLSAREEMEKSFKRF